jgi:competence protein ComEC
LCGWLTWPFAKLYDLLPRQQLVLVPALLGAAAYAALAGFAVSTQRALIMLSAFVLARFLARDVSLLKVLSIAATIIVIYHPFSLLESGFWLSCSAVLVIAVTTSARGTPTAQGGGISLLKLQPILWFTMLPLSLLLFGQVSLLSPLVNLLLVPLFCLFLIPATLLIFFITQIFQVAPVDLLLEALAICFDRIYQLLLFLSELPIATLSVTPLSLFGWGLFLICCGSIFYRTSYRFVLILAFFGMLLLTGSHSKPKSEVRMALLDVGQGLSMVFEVGDYVLVYDTGPAFISGFNSADAVLIPYLRHRGIHEIDQLIISHADNDHIGGFPYLQAALPINSILTSRTDKIPQAEPCKAGQTWRVGDVQFDVLSPTPSTPEGSNNHSCVLKVSTPKLTVLITGDIEKQVEAHLLIQPIDLSADIFLVPHQGSKTSSTTAFIDAVQPRLALIAAGYKNHYGHPHHRVTERYLQRGIELMSTIDSGTIVIELDGATWKSRDYRKENGYFWNR